jgi:iron complex outermembrane receptor protein
VFAFLDQEQKQTGLYVQDAMKVGNLRITLSGRQDWLDNSNFGAGKKEDAFSWRAGVNYVFDNGIAPYIVYATSFQPLAGADFNGKAFEPSKGSQIEAGVKVEPKWVPHGYKIFATAAVYDLTQDNVLISDPNHAFFQIQAGEVHVQGLEFEAVARIRERLTINASYSFTDAESTAGGQLQAVPKHKASAFIDYTIQDGGFRGLGAGLGVRYNGRNFGDDVNTYDFANTSQILVDAMVHYNYRDWKFVLNATNLFDETYVQRCSSYTQCFFATKRQVYFTIGRKF